MWGSQPALTSQWWRQVSTINIAHRIGRGLGQRLWQQQGAGGAGLAWESPPGSHNSHPSPVPADSRRGGPAFLTATSDGPLAHRASYLPRGTWPGGCTPSPWPGPVPSGVAGEVRMLFSQQAFGRLSFSGAVTVTVPLPGLATQALLSLKVDVISPCAQILPDGGAAPRRTVLGPHTGVTGACWLAPLTLPMTWVSVAYSTPGIHSKVPVPSASPHRLAGAP